MPGFIDVALMLFITASSWWERKTFRRWEQDVAAGDVGARRRNYGYLIRWEWIGLAVIAMTLRVRDVEASAVGLRMPQAPGVWLAAGLGAGILGLLAVQARMALRDPALKAQVRRAIEPLGYLLPAKRDDLGAWAGLSVTAGVVEELIARGYYIWVFSAVMPVWGAVFASSALFGLGHAYQGPRGVLKTGGAGLLLAVLYVAGGRSIWIPMVVHAGADLIQGWMAYRVQSSPVPDAPSGMEAA